MALRKFRYFVGDFETTVYEGQTNTEVWASACVELFTEDVKIFHSIDEQWDYLRSIPGNVMIYYHNLKFDGVFWLSYLMTMLKFEQAYDVIDEETEDVIMQKIKDMKNETFNYSISKLGQWYRIIIKVDNRVIEIRDSLKLLPFSVKRIGESFGTKHKKLDMEYTGFRYAGCKITPEEQKYIANDTLVIKEALEIMFREGHNKLTIGSCCLAEYRNIISWKRYAYNYPNLYEIELDKELYGAENAGKYIHKSYRGGWCYVVKGKENQVKENGFTADVNSLYPSMMSSESGNFYPVGAPTFWKGNYIPDEAQKPNRYFFIRVQTRFYLKKNYLPFIQVKGTLIYRPRDMLETSDIYNYKLRKYCRYAIDLEGNRVAVRPIITMTQTDFALLKKHYNLEDFEILDGCYFDAKIGLFDEYIDKYKKIKQESKGAKRELAKLFLNNLYGKMAAGTNSSFQVAYLREDESIGFYTCVANDKKPGYIAVGSAITSYARNFTITAAQNNYYGPNKPGFIYADTDSIHCDLPQDKVKGIQIHDKNFCCWKLESYWDKGLFVRPKTYIEHITHEDGEQLEKPKYNVKCAGMPDRSKLLFIRSITKGPLTEEEKQKEKLSPAELQFLETKRDMTDFKIGLVVPGKLIPKRIPGGVVLTETSYEMRARK